MTSIERLTNIRSNEKVRTTKGWMNRVRDTKEHGKARDGLILGEVDGTVFAVRYENHIAL